MKIFASAYKIQTNTFLFLLTTEKLLGINCRKTSQHLKSYRKSPFLFFTSINILLLPSLQQKENEMIPRCS